MLDDTTALGIPQIPRRREGKEYISRTGRCRGFCFSRWSQLSKSWKDGTAPIWQPVSFMIRSELHFLQPVMVLVRILNNKSNPSSTSNTPISLSDISLLVHLEIIWHGFVWKFLYQAPENLHAWNHFMSHRRDMNYCDASGMKCCKRDRKEGKQLASSRKK